MPVPVDKVVKIQKERVSYQLVLHAQDTMVGKSHVTPTVAHMYSRTYLSGNASRQKNIMYIHSIHVPGQYSLFLPAGRLSFAPSGFFLSPPHPAEQGNGLLSAPVMKILPDAVWSTNNKICTLLNHEKVTHTLHSNC